MFFVVFAVLLYPLAPVLQTLPVLDAVSAAVPEGMRGLVTVVQQWVSLSLCACTCCCSLPATSPFSAYHDCIERRYTRYFSWSLIYGDPLSSASPSGPA